MTTALLRLLRTCCGSFWNGAAIFQQESRNVDCTTCAAAMVTAGGPPNPVLSELQRNVQKDKNGVTSQWTNLQVNLLVLCLLVGKLYTKQYDMA